MNIPFIIFDVETNGFAGSSVLSISAIKGLFNSNNQTICKENEYNRYYFRNKGESLNPKAIEVNGLSDDIISEKRLYCDYPLYFNNDIDDFKVFCDNAMHYVGHNIQFDRQFIPYPLPFTFCTMHQNTNIVKTGWNSYYGTYKWPKLAEAALHYKIKLDSENLHSSSYDTALTYLIFESMLLHNDTKHTVLNFLSAFE